MSKKKRKSYDKNQILEGITKTSVSSVPKTKEEIKQEKKEQYKEFKAKAKARRKANVQSGVKKEKFGRRILNYFAGVKSETKKVVWPTKSETVKYTITVLVACTFFALLFWGLDTAFLTIMKSVFNIEGLST